MGIFDKIRRGGNEATISSSTLNLHPQIRERRALDEVRYGTDTKFCYDDFDGEKFVIPEPLFYSLNNSGFRSHIVQHGERVYEKSKLGFFEAKVVNPVDLVDYRRNNKKEVANCNDVVILNFFVFDENRTADGAGRRIDGCLSVFIDAADYDKLDIPEFISRTNADIRSCVNSGMNVYEILFRYPIIWSKYAKGLYIGDVINPKGIGGDKIRARVANIPAKISYDHAIKTKDGRLVIGSVKDNFIVPNQIEQSKPVETIKSKEQEKTIQPRATTRQSEQSKESKSTQKQVISNDDIEREVDESIKQIRPEDLKVLIKSYGGEEAFRKHQREYLLKKRAEEGKATQQKQKPQTEAKPEKKDKVTEALELMAKNSPDDYSYLLGALGKEGLREYMAGLIKEAKAAEKKK